jgi:hypothetical protein
VPVTAWSFDYDCRLALGFGFLFEHGGTYGAPRCDEMKEAAPAVKPKARFVTKEPEAIGVVLN